jgi:hypothetical protein
MKLLLALALLWLSSELGFAVTEDLILDLIGG